MRKDLVGKLRREGVDYPGMRHRQICCLRVASAIIQQVLGRSFLLSILFRLISVDGMRGVFEGESHQRMKGGNIRCIFVAFATTRTRSSHHSSFRGRPSTRSVRELLIVRVCISWRLPTCNQDAKGRFMSGLCGKACVCRLGLAHDSDFLVLPCELPYRHVYWYMHGKRVDCPPFSSQSENSSA